jgi:hypothetical protein
MSTKAVSDKFFTEEELQANEEPFTVAGWLESGRDLLKHEDFTNHLNRCMQWDIGDWLIIGEENSGPKKKPMKTKEYRRNALSVAGGGRYKSWGSLKNLMSVARNVPESVRRDGREGRRFLDYNIHVIVAPFNADVQDQLLSEAESALAWSNPQSQDTDATPLIINGRKVRFSVKTFRDYVAVKQKKGELPACMSGRRVVRLKPSDATKGSYVKVFVNFENYEQLRCVSVGSKGGVKLVKGDGYPHGERWVVDEEAVGRLLYETSRRCLTEHKDEYKPAYLAGKKRIEELKQKDEEAARFVQMARAKSERAAD